MIEWIILALLYSSARQYTYEFTGNGATKSDWQTHDLCSKVKTDIIDNQDFLIHLDNPAGSWEGAWYFPERN